jgi:hypothetical protein
MGHPLIDQFCSVKGPDHCRSDFFYRCQRVFREEVQPQLDERERLLEENAELKATIEKLRAKKKPEVSA